MEISESLQRFIKSRGLSQRQLSEKIGIPYQSYQTYEYGSSIPSAKVIIKLSKAFEVSTDYLLGLSDEPRPVPADKALVDAIINARDSIQKVLSEVDKVAEGAKQQ